MHLKVLKTPSSRYYKEMLEDIIQERRKKLDAIRAAGIDPYPARVKRSFEIAYALAEFDALAASTEKVSLTGRLRSLRDHGQNNLCRP